MSDADPPREPPVLGNGDLRLRGWAPSDAPAVLEACQDPELQRWLPVPVPYLPEHAEGFVGGFASDQWSTGRGAPFAAVHTATGRLLGSFGLKDIDHVGRSAEAGYWVVAGSRGQGVARRAARLLVDWAFDNLELDRVVFLVEPANGASCNVVESLGAVRTSLERDSVVVHGTLRDTARYVLRAPDRGRV